MPTQSKSRNVRPARPQPRTKKPAWLWPVLVGVVVLLAVVAVVVSRGSDDSESDTAVANEQQVRPVAVTGSPLPLFTDSATDPAVGALAPAVAGASFDGSPVSITRDGRPKVLVFAAHWCPHCQREIPVLVDHLRDQPVPSGVDVILVATGTTDTRPNYPPSAWLAKEGWTHPVLVDDADATASAAYGLAAYPYFVAIDSSGRAVSRTSGEISVAEFDQLVATAMAGGSA